jgi:hypothetical protein
MARGWVGPQGRDLDVARSRVRAERAAIAVFVLVLRARRRPVRRVADRAVHSSLRVVGLLFGAGDSRKPTTWGKGVECPGEPAARRLALHADRLEPLLPPKLL